MGVMDMRAMFYGASQFDRDIDQWDVSKVRSEREVFWSISHRWRHWPVESEQDDESEEDF
jgi:hypothetical protein